jgi:hypothetical protein
MIFITSGTVPSGQYSGTNIFNYNNVNYIVPPNGQIIRVEREPARDLEIPAIVTQYLLEPDSVPEVTTDYESFNHSDWGDGNSYFYPPGISHMTTMRNSLEDFWGKILLFFMPMNTQVESNITINTINLNADS